MDFSKGKAAIIIGCLIVLGFGWFVFFLLRNISAEVEDWTRMTYVFEVIKAIAITAVGFFFGSKVNSERAVNAEKRAEANQLRVQKAERVLGKVGGRLSGISSFLEEKKVAATSAQMVQISNSELDELQNSIRSLETDLIIE